MMKTIGVTLGMCLAGCGAGADHGATEPDGGGAIEADCSYSSGGSMYAVASVPGLDPSSAPSIAVLGCPTQAPAAGMITGSAFEPPKNHCSPPSPSAVLVSPDQVAVACNLTTGPGGEQQGMTHYFIRVVR